MDRHVLTDAELVAASRQLPAWDVTPERLHRVFRFANFVEAFGFMASAALVCERRDHHPEWRNVYGEVDVIFTTHDRGGVTAFDVDLAAAFDELAGGR